MSLKSAVDGQVVRLVHDLPAGRRELVGEGGLHAPAPVGLRHEHHAARAAVGRDAPRGEPRLVLGRQRVLVEAVRHLHVVRQEIERERRRAPVRERRERRDFLARERADDIVAAVRERLQVSGRRVALGNVVDADFRAVGAAVVVVRAEEAVPHGAARGCRPPRQRQQQRDLARPLAGRSRALALPLPERFTRRVVRVMLVPGLQPALRAERARISASARMRPSSSQPASTGSAPAGARASAPRSTEDWMPSTIMLLVRLALGASGEELVARHQGRHGIRDAQVRELHARAGRERRRVVAGNSRQDLGRARAVAARERDLGVETRLFARIGCGERLREIGDRGFGCVGLRRLQPFARRREPERVRRARARRPSRAAS